MTGIYKVNKKGEIELVQDAINLCPELSFLKPDELKYIVLVYDYIDSPLKNKPKAERKKIAIKIIWKSESKNPEKNESVREGIEFFKSLIYDSRREVIDTCKLKISILNERLSSVNVTTSRDIQDLDKAMIILQKRIDQNEEDIKKDEEIIELKGGKQLSLIERMKRSQKLYNIAKKIDDGISSENQN